MSRARMSGAPAGPVGAMMRTGPRRIGLRPRDARGGRQRGSDRGQMQEFAAGKFHVEPPSPFTSFDHLIGAAEQRQRNCEAERVSSLEVDNKLQLRCLMDW